MYSILYVTTKNKTEAQTIAQQIVKERLAACANILPQMESIYWWEDKIQQTKEAVLIFKTTKKNVNALKKRIKELHSYEIPCILVLDIKDGHKAFLDFISAETLPR